MDKARSIETTHFMRVWSELSAAPADAPFRQSRDNDILRAALWGLTHEASKLKSNQALTSRAIRSIPPAEMRSSLGYKLLSKLIVENRDVENTRALIQGKPDLFSKAMDLACRNKDLAMIRMLVDCEVKPTDKAMEAACEKGDIELVQKLIEAGVDLNGKGGSRVSHFIIACGNGHNEIALLLIEKGAKAGVNELAIAMHKNHLDLIEKIVQKDPSVLHQRLKRGNTFLHIACAQYSAAMVSKLIDLGADISATNAKGMTPVFFALYPTSREEIIQHFFRDFPGLSDVLFSVAAFPDPKPYIEEILEQWVRGAATIKVPDRSVLEIPMLLGDKKALHQMITAMSEKDFKEASNIFCKRYGRNSTLNFVDCFFTVNAEHYHAGAIVKEKLPAWLPRENIMLLTVETARLGGRLKNSQKIAQMIRKIFSGEAILGLGSLSPQERDKWYLERCRYLLHIIEANKIGQAGADSDSVLRIMENLAELQDYCAPRWKDHIRQMYDYRPRHGKEVIASKSKYNLGDRILQRLRERRIGIIRAKLNTDPEATFHHLNAILDRMCEPLGTRLPPTGDPFHRESIPSLHVLMERYKQHESSEEIVRDIFEHLLGRNTGSGALTDFTPDEAYQWLRERVAVTWKAREYDGLKSKVEAMSRRGAPKSEIQTLLAEYELLHDS